MTATAEQVLKDLRNLWTDLGSREEHGVLRACAMTLLTADREDCDDSAVGETMAQLMHEHPSRAILLRIRADASVPLTARVTAQCWMPFGKRQQICCEQVVLDSGSEELPAAAALLRALTVPDLPVVLYCRDHGLLGVAGFAEIVPLASKVILDGRTADGAREVLDRLSGLERRGIRSADLAWAALTPWREAVAEIFDDPAARKAMYGLEDVRILYAHADDPVAAWYMGGWFMHVLGATPHVRIARGVGPARGGIARVSLHGPGFEASVELLEDRSVETRVNGLTHNLVFPPETEYELLREELSATAPDKVFRDVLGLAAMLRAAP